MLDTKAILMIAALVIVASLLSTIAFNKGVTDGMAESTAIPACTFDVEDYQPICRYDERVHMENGSVAQPGDYQVDCDRSLVWCDDEGS